MKANRRFRMRDDDRGQLMLLSGIVIIISFILTALTVSQVSALQRRAGSEPATTLPTEWRFLHTRISNSFEVAVGTATDNATLRDTLVPTVAATFRAAGTEKGLDTVIRLPDNAQYPLRESDLVTAGFYAATSDDGDQDFDWAYDGSDDGMIWKVPCPDSGGPAAGCIAGILVFVSMSDGESTINETILFDLNNA